MRADFCFRDTWEVAASPGTVHDVLVDLAHYPAWWPQVLAVASLGPDHARVLCRSTLPYTLDLVLHARDRSVEQLEVGVAGDLDGVVRFGLSETAGGTRIDFAQQVSVGGWLGAAALPARRLLQWNHDRMMQGCRRGLTARLA